jgi:tetratricopeptide (TPR) repeat protein
MDARVKTQPARVVSHRGAACLALALQAMIGVACHKRTVIAAPATPVLPDPASVAAGFERSIGEGCYLCLADVIRAFRDLSAPIQAAEILQPVVERASLLLMARVRELGLPPDDVSTFAETFANERAQAGGDALLAEIAQHVSWNVLGTGEGFIDRDRGQHGFTPQVQRDGWRTALAPDWRGNDAAAYLYASLLCGSPQGAPAELAAVKAAFPQSRAIRYRLATCRQIDETVLRPLVVEVPRFFEAVYALGERAMAGQHYAAAEEDWRQAREGLPRFTAAGVQLTELELKGDQYADARDVATGVVHDVPDHWRAQLDLVKALSQLKLPDEAIAEATRLIDGGHWFVGDAYYWRAWNEYQRESFDSAMADVEATKDYERTARVFALGGVVRMGQSRWIEAREELLQAKRLDSGDCNISFYLGHVYSKLVAWKDSAGEFAQAADCDASAELAIQAEIAVATQAADEWSARRLDQLKQDLAAAIEQKQASVYNAGAMFANAGVVDKAETYATRAEAFPPYTERARALLVTLRAKLPR